MSEFRKKIEELGTAADHLRSEPTIVGIVTKRNEKSNTCSIEFRDKDGYLSNKDNVEVKIYNVSIIDWFPEVGQWVELEQTMRGVIITGPAHAANRTSARVNTETKKDIYTSSFIDTIGGNIL